MICKEFENWILTKKITVPALNPAAQDHKDNCPSCSKLYDFDHAVEEKICDAFRQTDIPDSLYEQVETSINHLEKPTGSVLNYKLVISAILFFIAITAAFYTLNKPFRYNNLNQLSETAVLRHLQGPGELEFSADTMDSALIKMSKALNFNVILPDLSAQHLPGPDYTLQGGRICTLGKCKIAYLVYRQQEKICSVFILDYDNLGFKMADGSRFNNEVKGLQALIWKELGQVYAMVY